MLGDGGWVGGQAASVKDSKKRGVEKYKYLVVQYSPGFFV